MKTKTKLKLYAGLDVHSAKTYATVLGEKGDLVGEGEFPTNRKGFETFFKEFKKQDLKSVFEASGICNYVAKLLREQNISFIIAHPTKVKAIAHARIKTDKIDSRILAHLLRTNMVPESYLPSPELLEVRNLVRHRVKIGRIGGQLKNHIRAVLRKEGLKLPFSTVDGVKARAWLSKVEVSPNTRLELDSYLFTLNQVKARIKILDKKISEEVVKRPLARLITTIPGFAEYSALLIICEIGDVKRFPTSAKLASYAGLVGSVYQSSNTIRRGRITKEGNVWLRWILVECTNISVMRDNKLRTFYLRLKEKKGHQKAIVATSRKTLTIIWTMLQKQQTFQ